MYVLLYDIISHDKRKIGCLIYIYNSYALPLITKFVYGYIGLMVIDCKGSNYLLVPAIVLW